MSELKTALYDWHVAHGAKMVPFAGYAMPVQYADGIVKEHGHTRTAAGVGTEPGATGADGGNHCIGHLAN